MSTTSQITGRKYLFIGGAPRCGTSSMFAYLEAHPAIIPSARKETFFMIDKGHPFFDLHGSIYKEGWEGFGRLWPQPGPAGPHTFLEGTTQLLYQKEVFPFLDQLQDYRVIFLLREPARRILSGFEFAKYNSLNFSRELPFSQYVDMLLSGKTENLKDYVRYPSHYFLAHELEFSTYHIHLARWLERIDPDRIKVLPFESFKRQPEKTVFDTLVWLGYDPPAQIDTTARNVTIYPKSARLHATMKGLGRIIPRGAWKKAIKEWYLRLQPTQKPRDESVQEGLNLLLQHFKEPNQKLADLIDLDLSLWDQAASTSTV